jgi:hypothetical protein
MAKTNVRIPIPTNPADLLDLAESINSVHVADGDQSPLKALKVHSWETNGPEVQTAKTFHKQAEDYKAQSELSYRKRDLILPELNESVKASRDLLLGIYRDNPKELTRWGFEVIDTPKASKKVAE